MKKENVVAVSHSMFNCSFCANESKDQLKCTHCGYPLSNNIDYFNLFALKKQYQIDKSELYKSYLSLQQQFHPDKCYNKEAHNQLEAERVSTLINTAFNLLKNDRKRGEYLLSMQNIFVNSAQDNISPDSELLSEIFAVSETVSEIDDQQRIYLELDKAEEKILNYFSEFTTNIKQNNNIAAAQNLIAIRYYEKIITEIQHKLEQS